MEVYESDGKPYNVVDEEAHFRKLGKNAAKKTIANLREELKELSE